MSSTATNLLIAGLGAILYETLESRGKRHEAMLHARTGREPWQTVQLLKSERRGKTPEQIRALRILKWEQQQEETVQ